MIINDVLSNLNNYKSMVKRHYSRWRLFIIFNSRHDIS